MGSALSVVLTSTSATGTFSPQTTVAIPAGGSDVNFYYADTTAGAPTITATAAGFAPATQQEIVVAAAPSQVAFITAAQTLTAGVPSQTMTVQLEDAFGNPASAASTTTIRLSTTSANGTFSPCRR